MNKIKFKWSWFLVNEFCQQIVAARTATKFSNPIRALKHRSASWARRHPTKSELAMWKLLQRNSTGYRFDRQILLAGYILDFRCATRGLIVEVDGDYHSKKYRRELDEKRDRIMTNYGYRTLRVTDPEVLTNPNLVMDRIKTVLELTPLWLQ